MHGRSTLLRKIVIAYALALTALAATAIPPVFSTTDGAIRGYDPVAYFTNNKPIKGKKGLSYTWNGATWYFVSQANLDAFKEDPLKYAPQYGGYCSFGVAQGYTPETDPEAFKVVQGKLYLNNSKAIAKRWEQDIPGYVRDANENWPRCLKKDGVKEECPKE